MDFQWGLKDIIPTKWSEDCPVYDNCWLKDSHYPSVVCIDDYDKQEPLRNFEVWHVITFWNL